MHEFIDELNDLCKTLEREISDHNQKIKVGGRLSVEDLRVIDQLTHALKSVKTTMAMMEAGSQGYNAGERESHMGSNRGSYADNSYEGVSNYYNEGSERRGRNSMGRFVSRAGDVREEMRELMEHTNDPMVKQRLLSIMEEM
jgi:hypothetical protein